jgi:hypothetical protein
MRVLTASVLCTMRASATAALVQLRGEARLGGRGIDEARSQGCSALVEAFVCQQHRRGVVLRRVERRSSGGPQPFWCGADDWVLRARGDVVWAHPAATVKADVVWEQWESAVMGLTGLMRRARHISQRRVVVVPEGCFFARAAYQHRRGPRPNAPA